MEDDWNPPRQQQEPPQKWYSREGEQVKFGSSTDLFLPLRGSAEEASAWMLGAGDDDRVGEVVSAAVPKRVRLDILERNASGVTRFVIAMPDVTLFGFGTMKSSVGMWAKVQPSGCSHNGGGPCLVTGCDGLPSVSLAWLGGMATPLRNFDLDIDGALGIDMVDGSPAVVGSIAVKVQGKASGSWYLSDQAMRLAASTIIDKTLGYMTRRLVDNLASDFERWQDQRSLSAPGD